MDTETRKVQKMTETNSNKTANEKHRDKQFEEFKQKYDEIGLLSKNTEAVIAKALSSKQVNSRDKIVLNIFQLQQKMLSDALRNSLANDYKVSYLEEALNGLYRIVRSTLLKLDKNLVDVNGEVEKIKATLNNPMYSRIDQFISIMAENEKQNQANQKQKQPKSGEYIA